jgi:hypothetical protein
MKIQMLEEMIQELEKKSWQENKAQQSLGKKGHWFYEEGAGGEGGVGREGWGISLEEWGHQGHRVMTVQWGPRVLQGCPSFEKVVLQDLLFQALTLDVYLLFSLCVINLVNMMVICMNMTAIMYVLVWMHEIYIDQNDLE